MKKPGEGGHRKACHPQKRPTLTGTHVTDVFQIIPLSYLIIPYGTRPSQELQ